MLESAEMSIRCANHNGDPIYHETVADVRFCFTNGPVADFDPTDSGVKFPIQGSRAADPDWMRTDYGSETEATRAALAQEAAEQVRTEYVRTATLTRTPVTQDGMYIKADGQIFKVQYNRAKGDGRRLYAKQLVVRTLDGGRAVRQTSGLLDVLKESISPLADMDFVYASGAIYQLCAEERMTPEQAKQFGKLYGRCVRCGRVLTLEESIDRMMGAVCAGKL
jgi:hypothetical protein